MVHGTTASTPLGDSAGSTTHGITAVSMTLGTIQDSTTLGTMDTVDGTIRSMVICTLTTAVGTADGILTTITIT